MREVSVAMIESAGKPLQKVWVKLEERFCDAANVEAGRGIGIIFDSVAHPRRDHDHIARFERPTRFAKVEMASAVQNVDHLDERMRAPFHRKALAVMTLEYQHAPVGKMFLQCPVGEGPVVVNSIGQVSRHGSCRLARIANL